MATGKVAAYSPGHRQRLREQEDLSTALKYLDGKYHKTAIAAFSFGGSISINVLSESKIPVHSFICISAPSDASKVDYKLWKLDIENDIYYTLLTKDGRKGKGFRMGPFWLPKQKPIDSIGKINIPTLFIHGDKDWVIDMWHSKALYEKAVSLKKLIIIKDGPHAEYLIRKHTPIFFKEINTWLQETM